MDLLEPLEGLIPGDIPDVGIGVLTTVAGSPVVILGNRDLGTTCLPIVEGSDKGLGMDQAVQYNLTWSVVDEVSMTGFYAVDEIWPRDQLELEGWNIPTLFNLPPPEGWVFATDPPPKWGSRRERMRLTQAGQIEFDTPIWNRPGDDPLLRSGMDFFPEDLNRICTCGEVWMRHCASCRGCDKSHEESINRGSLSLPRLP